MKEQVKEVKFDTPEPVIAQVVFSIQSHIAVLHGSWTWELNSTMVFCSDVMSFPETFEGTRGIIHPEDLDKVKGALSLVPDMALGLLSFRIITTYGAVHTLVGSQVHLLEDAPGVPGTFTAEAGWEQAFREADQVKEAAFLRLRNTLADRGEQYTDTATWYVNKTTGDSWYSDQVYRIFGLPPQSLNAHPHTFISFIHPEDKVAVLDAFEQAFNWELPLHINYRIVRPCGEIVWVRQLTYWECNNLGQPVLGGLLRNLQEEQDLQAQLSSTEAQLQLHQQVLQQAEKQSHFGYWFMDMVTRKTTFSAAYLRLHGLKPGTMVTHAAFLDMVHPDDKAMVASRMAAMNKTHELPETNYRIIRPDGKVRHLQLSGRLSVFPNQELVMLGVATDLTPQKVQEQTLKELKDTLILQNHTLGLAEELGGLASLLLFPDGTMRWSDGLYRMLGYRPLSVEPLLVVLRKSIHPAHVKAFDDTFALVMNQQEVTPLSIRIITRTGIRQLLFSFSTITEQGRTAIAAMVQDLTRQQEQARQFAHLERYNKMLEDGSKDLLIYTNTENAVVGWNAAAVAKTGIKKEDALRANLFDLLPNLRSEAYLAQLNTALNGREVQVHKGRFQYLYGPQSYLLTPHLDEHGAVLGVLHLVQDTAKEQDLQLQLSERLNFIESLVDASVDRIVVLDKDMNYLYWNPKAEAYYALAKEKVLGKNILEVFPGFRNDPSYQEFRKALKGETVHLPASFSPGKQHYFETYLIPVRDEQGNVNALLWMVHDLSHEGQLQQERQQAMELLAEEHWRLNEAQAIGHIGSFEWNLGAETVSWSDELYRIMGLEPRSRQIITSETNDWIHPDDRDAVLALKQRSIEKPGIYQAEHRIVRPDGKVIQVAHRFESMAGESGRVERVHGTVQDISERVAVRQQVEASEGLLRAAEMVAQTGSYEVELATMTFRFSEGMYRLFGEAPFSFEPSLDFIDSRSHPDDIAPVKAVLERAAADRQPYFYTRRIYRKDGALRTLEAHGQVKCDEQGNPIRFVGLVQDVTDKHAAARQQEQQALFLNSITQAVPDLICVVELPGKRMHLLNKELFAANGLNPGDQDYLEWEALESKVEPAGREALAQFYQRVETMADDEVALIDVRFSGPGNTLWLRNRTKVFRRNEQGRASHLLTILQDVTRSYENKEALTSLNASLQQKNRELETKNEEITSYAFIASHDLREPIRKLHTFTDLLQQKEAGNLSAIGRDLLERMTKSVDKLGFIIGDILSLSQIHSEPSNFDQVNLHQVLERVKTDLDEEIGSSGAEIVVSGEPTTFRAMENQVFYLLKNLLSNAIKFQAEGNRPLVTIKCSLLPGTAISQHHASGNYFKLEIADNGIGFDPMYKKQVFRIFQRLHNKEAFTGNGMGLAICRKVMENHGGFIDVDSDLGKGTMFCCYFPV